MRLSTDGRALIQSFEGLMLKAYPDADGYSIGYGHFLGKDPSLASAAITRAEADALFDQDVAKFEAAVSVTTNGAPSTLQHEFDAMVSLAYNIGTGNLKTGKDGFAGSSVARYHNMGDKQSAADSFLLWNKETKNGVKVENPTLTRRRDKERSVYLGGYSAPGSFPVPPPEQSTDRWPSGGISSAPSSPPAGSSSGAIALTVVALAAAIGWTLLHR